jgi:CDGSH-type Zn-finger protein
VIDGGLVKRPDKGGMNLYDGDKAALCRCGGSANKPFRDERHPDYEQLVASGYRDH